MSSPEQNMAIDHDHDHDDSAGSERRSLRDRVLRTAVDLVHERGEAGLKISDVVALSGASVGTIYAEFGDREGLVQAVQVELFRGQAAIDAAALSALVEHARSREDMVEGLCAIARMSIDASRTEHRWQRVSVIGAARRRPEVADALAELQGTLRDQIAAFVVVGQERGFVDPAVDPVTLSAFIQAYTIGKILTELGPGTEVDDDAWVDLVRRFAGSCLVPD